jgi:glucokinase-like ROK family protein
MPVNPAQPELLKEINLARLFEVLRELKLVSRPELARRTGLSRTTVALLSDDLLRLGLAEQVGMADSTGGRPAVLFKYNPTAACALGATIAEREWRLVLADLDGRVLRRTSVRSSDDTPAAAIEALAEGVAALKRQEPTLRLLPAIGLGTPGLVDARTGVIKTAVDVGWAEVPICQMVAERLGLKALVANRSRVGALGELFQGAGRQVNDLLYLSLGTGIAAGIIHERRLYAGANSSAGELGHVTIVPDGPACPCGNRGCLQQLASAPAIVALAGDRLLAGGTSILRDLVGERPERLTGELVLRAAEEGDALAMEVARQVAGYLGIAVANLVNLFNPELIVLGGPLGRFGKGLIAPLREEVQRRAMAYPLSAVRIVTSDLGADAPAIGAAVLVLQQASELIFHR